MSKKVFCMNHPKDFMPVGGIIFFLACIGFSTQADAPLLGQLFFSDEERQELDRLRNENKKHKPHIAEKEESASTKSFTINGIVVCSNGNSTFWINGVPVSGNDAYRRGIHLIERDNTVEVGFSCDSSIGSNGIRAKPGEEVVCGKNDPPDPR
uniref:Uncharacterized protein n=1 Tax=Candidatus Kentrum sp. SD TaxID=2126332 RepID=A0A450Y4G1_9GAMM|nr:MAG: hypothetical protein BECKSD772F_GA0070984_100172 [Candidatus Kentron sp. SD]VFK38670.1 MAG: hypothetical protein BECKSD772E_GA0070983_100171 [Candidatus Kentron sp. SD]